MKTRADRSGVVAAGAAANEGERSHASEEVSGSPFRNHRMADAGSRRGHGPEQAIEFEEEQHEDAYSPIHGRGDGVRGGTVARQ